MYQNHSRFVEQTQGLLLGFDKKKKKKIDMVHFMLYSMLDNVTLLSKLKGDIIQSWLYKMKGSTKLRYNGLLCKHKVVSVLEASVMLRITRDAIGKEFSILELISVCCAIIRHL